MNSIRVSITALAVALSMVSAVPAFAVELPAEEVVASIEGEVRPDVAKDPSALLVSPESAPAIDGISAPEVAPLDSASSDAVITGGNLLPITGFKDGDIIIGFNAWTVGHAGILDATRGISLNSSCVWSAVKESPGCVGLEKPLKYRGYDWAAGLWVPKALLSQRTSARRFCSAQIGERYNLFSAKSDHSQWYCSKLPWAGYLTRAARDLDPNGGYWVSPADLYNDADTKVFAFAH